MGLFSNDEEIVLENADLDVEPQNEYVSKETVEKIDDILDAGEKVYYLAKEAGGAVEVKKGSEDSEQKVASKGQIRAAATDRRVVVKIPKLLGDEEISLPYDKISSIGMRSGVVQTKLVIETSSQTYLIGIGSLAEDACKNMQKFIRNMAADNSKTNRDQSPDSSNDPLEQIEKLEQLNESGAISDDEFEQKKEELLNKL